MADERFSLTSEGDRELWDVISEMISGASAVEIQWKCRETINSIKFIQAARKLDLSVGQYHECS